MIRWRSDTVTTFQTTIVNPLMAKPTITGTASGQIAGIASISALATTVSMIAFIRPRARSTRSAANEPISEPTARGVITTPNPASVSPIGPGATAQSGNTENMPVWARLEMPVMSANVRSTR